MAYSGNKDGGPDIWLAEKIEFISAYVWLIDFKGTWFEARSQHLW